MPPVPLFVAVLAMNMDYPLLTGDKEFKKLRDKVKVEWMRERIFIK
ncbi:MAG TPA: hypothetical protein VJ000_00020 [Thermodesulfovibrionia bacterium]|nr:hypothetical protein [Thermodesulfovibrionia bacterium]